MKVLVSVAVLSVTLFGSAPVYAQNPPPGARDSTTPQESETVFIPIEQPKHASVFATNRPMPTAENCPCCGSTEAIEKELEVVGAKIAAINTDGTLNPEQRRARLKPLLKDIVHLLSHLSDAEGVRREKYVAEYEAKLIKDGMWPNLAAYYASQHLYPQVVLQKARNALLAAVQPWRIILNARRTLGMQRSNPNFGEHIPNILIMVVGTEIAEKTSFFWLPALANSLVHVENPVALGALGISGYLLNQFDLLCSLNPFIYVAFPPLQRALTWLRGKLDASLGRAYRAVTHERLAVLRTYTRDLAVEDIEENRFRITDLHDRTEAVVVRKENRFYVESFVIPGATQQERLAAGRYLAERLGHSVSDAVRRTTKVSYKPFYVENVTSTEIDLRIEFKTDAVTVSRTFAERPLNAVKPCDALLIDS